MNSRTKMKMSGWLLAVGMLAQLPSSAMARTALLWEPIEWQYENHAGEGNPFDVVAKAEFRHEDGEHRINTELYYAGGNVWVLRFTGTAPGKWSFTTQSSDPDLDGQRGDVMIEPNPRAAGFMTAYGNKWGRLGLDEAFVPQIVSYCSPIDYFRNPGKIDADLKIWFEQHGFNGLHTFVSMAWFDIEKGRDGYKAILSDDPNPDLRTFQALELLITKTHRAGGMVHVWAWGDEQRHMTTLRWGLNGKVDQRLQRYICARLGPLPGWSMGYGFDLQEWVNRDQLAAWHRFMHDHLGWPHFLGARAPDLEQIYDGLDYSSYQQHRPTYGTYVEAIERRHAGKPSFLEDRFRVRLNVYPEKDYDLDMTRRGLWNSTMAGGAANIWAYLINAPQDGSSAVYPNREQLLTCSRFWRGRFFKEMVRNNARTDGVCLEVPGAFCVFYKENTDSVQMDLTGMKAPLQAIAVDTRAAYKELPLTDLDPSPGQRFRASHRSDWAIAVGRTEQRADIYFPPPESQGGWRKLEETEDIRRLAGMDPGKLAELKQWLLDSDDRPFAADVIRHGFIVLEVERGNSAKTDDRRVASVSKAVCATVLAIASDRSQHGLTPRKMRFDDAAFQFIPWSQPLSDPRKAKITVKQLLNHTSGICPEATGAANDGTWEYILGHSGDQRTAKLAFDPGTGCGYSTLALAHAALVCENVTGQPYDQFAIEALFKPLGIERWWFQYYDGGPNMGRHPSHGLGLSARDLARLAYCMLHDGRWKDQQVIPQWFVEQTSAPTHQVKTPEMRWQLNPQIFSHGWELPARHWPASGRSGEGIPADAREKPGSGGQMVAFVPSLDLVVTRQTGGSGDWQFEQYLRRACAAVVPESPR